MVGPFVEHIEEILMVLCYYNTLGTVPKDIIDCRMIEHLSDPRRKP